jgi:hypothetical protein
LQRYEVILGEALQIEALVQQGKGTLEAEKVQGVRNLGKETRGDLLFLEGLQPKEQQKRTVEKSVEYLADRKVLSHCALSGFEGTRTGRLAVGSSRSI